MNILKNKINAFWMLFLSLILVKYGYYGFKYYPVIDDWIQYRCYTLSNNIFKDVIIGAKTYTTRPLASLSDPYIWGQLWGSMGVAFFIITLLHFFSAYFLYKMFELNKIKVGLLFLVIYGLLPLGTEATYWISASSRIVIGMFFMALSLYFLSLYIHKYNDKLRYVLAFAIFSLISFGYYEQVIVLGFISALCIIVFNFKNIKNKWIIGIPFINLFVIGSYYISFKDTGNMAQRGGVVKLNFKEHFNIVFDKITDVWGRAHLPMYTNGFKRGIEVLLNNRSYIYIFLIILCSILSAIFVFKNKYDEGIKVNLIKILLGILLFWVPYAPYFLLDVIWISNRNAFTSFVGLGLIIDGFINMVFRGKILKFLKAAGIGAAVLIFLVVNISEITDYKNFSLSDKKICTNIIEAGKNTGFLEGKKSVVLFNTMPAYPEQNIYFHEHINNVTAADWSLTGGVRAMSESLNVRFIKTVKAWYPISLSEDIWDGNKYVVLGIDADMNVFNLNFEKDDNEIILSKENGEPFGRIQPIENGMFRFIR